MAPGQAGKSERFPPHTFVPFNMRLKKGAADFKETAPVYKTRFSSCAAWNQFSVELQGDCVARDTRYVPIEIWPGPVRNEIRLWESFVFQRCNEDATLNNTVSAGRLCLKPVSRRIQTRNWIAFIIPIRELSNQKP